MYAEAKEGKGLFAPHFFPWWMLPEYAIELGDPRIGRYISETNEAEFKLTSDEERLHTQHNLTYSQLRWRRWKIMQMASLKREGETRTLFSQEFPEDDVSCFLATGDQYFDQRTVNIMAESCYPAPNTFQGAQVWYPPEPNKRYVVCIDPGQAKITQTAIGVMTFDVDGDSIKPKWCARDSGLYLPELTAKKALALSNFYNRAMIAWEANSHGMAITELLKKRRPIYFRKDVISGQQSLEPGWLTTKSSKDYMYQRMHLYLQDIICHDIEIPRQMRNHRQVGDKVVVVGSNDIFMSLAIGLVTFDPKPARRGLVGVSGWHW
jgi:hypothetical protein